MVKLPMLLWVCRLLNLVVVYRYHDWQSIVPLIWVLHSTLFRSRQRFVRMTLNGYIPLMIAGNLWYYLININGLINFANY